MADERNKPSWWQSAPGLMTATAAVIAAVSGLLGGLNQMGIFDRWKQSPAVESASRSATVPESASTTRETGTTGNVPRSTTPTTAPKAAGSSAGLSRARRTAQPATKVVGPAVRRADTSTVPTETGDSARPGAARPDSASTPPISSSATDTAPDSVSPSRNTGGQIPSGTVLELAAANRICSTTSEPGDRVPATVVVPVTGTGGAAVPVGTTAILEVTRLDAPVFLGVRADSLSLNGRGYVLREATTRVHQREFTAGAGQSGVGIGACIPAGGRITVTLRSPVTLGGGS
jgi:hypothetical protein